MKRIIIAPLLLLCSLSLVAQAVQDYREQNRNADQETKVTATMKSSSRLFGEKDDLTTVIMILPSGSVVDVLDSDSAYYHVVFEENEGFIFKRHAEINPSAARRMSAGNSARTTQETRETQPVQSQRVSRFSYLENKYGSNVAARLMEGKIWLGMSAEMVKDSWGSPQKINRVISGNFIKEEWTYNNTWLYIENNTLREWGPLRGTTRQ